jgi:hypothetical protein
MKQPYGKMSKAKTTKGPSADRLVIDIRDRHTIEQMSLELQKMLATLHDLGAYGMEACTIYLKPLDQKGELIALYDEKGSQITRLQFPPAAETKPYRGE